MLAALCLLLSMAACGRHVPASGAAAPPTAGSEILLRPDLAPAVKIMPLAGTTAELTWDDKRGALWLVDRADDVVSLLQIAGASIVRRISLTGTHEPTVTQHVRVSPDGSVWVTDGYQVSRVDPEAMTVDAIALAHEVRGMESGATDGGNAWAGTWVSALTFDSDGSAILARLNVPRLQVLSPALDTEGWIALPEAGRRIGDAVLTRAGFTWLPLEDEAPRATPPTVRRLTLSLPARITPPSVTNPADAVLRDTMNGSSDPGVVSIHGRALTADSRAGTISQTRQDGSSRVISFPRHREEIGAPDGQSVTVADVPVPVLALAFGAEDAIWFVSRQSGAASLYRLDGPHT